jgi:hypothetical protein
MPGFRAMTRKPTRGIFPEAGWASLWSAMRMRLLGTMTTRRNDSVSRVRLRPAGVLRSRLMAAPDLN